MKQFKGRIELARFRNSKMPLLIPCLLLSLVLIIVAVVMLFAKKELPIAGIFAVVSFAISMTGIMLINKINKEYYIEIRSIKLKYGIKVNTDKEVK